VWQWSPTQSDAFAQFAITQATNSGTATVAAISPDGRFIAHVERSNGMESLWLRNIDSGSNTEIEPAARVLYASLAFSPDGNYIYSRIADGGSLALLNLHRAPILGGTRQQVIRDIDSNVTFSPDGSRIAFVRANSPKLGVMSIVTSGADGSNEEVLLTETMGAAYSSTPAWSPDGRLIAYAAPRSNQALGRLAVFELSSRETRTVMSSNDMQLLHPHWSSDQRNLMLLYAAKSTALTQNQIGIVSYPGGAFRTITNDTNHYLDLHLSADARSVVSVVRRQTSAIAVLPAAGGRSINIAEARRRIPGFAWTADGAIVFPRGNQLVARAADGAERPVFVADANSPPQDPSVCLPTGQVVFVWPYRNGSVARNVWRINADGSEPQQLSDFENAQNPSCSPDGQWVAFAAPTGVHRVRTSGGTPELIYKGVSFGNIAWSPDNKTVAIVSNVRGADGGKPARKFVLITVETGATTMLDVGDSAGGHLFTPDGSAIAYAPSAEPPGRILIQPRDGSAPRVLVSSDEGLGHFRWSPDGTRLAVLRVHTDADVVLLRDGAPPRR
jgi:Tol biopolymer transport system component